MKFLDKLKERIQQRDAQVDAYNAARAERIDPLFPSKTTEERMEELRNGFSAIRDKFIEAKDSIVSTDEVYKSRIEICQTCDHFNKTTVTCNKCGCFMKLKTRLVSAHCPIDKW
jgi:hypothetical protein